MKTLMVAALLLGLTALAGMLFSRRLKTTRGDRLLPSPSACSGARRGSSRMPIRNIRARFRPMFWRCPRG